MSQATTSQRLRPFKPLRFGRYTLLMPISTGGMGEIFLARLEGAHGFDKLCVIKKILAHLAEDGDFVERFVNEARILVKLSHGNIAQVLDMGVHEGAPYIALEFVDGKDLRRVLARMRDRQMNIPLSFVLYAMTRVLDALAYAHRKRGDDDRELNLVHRDVSPQNVLISYEGEVKVIDFGLAKSTLSSSKTNPSIILGKFMYMSPEQARHQKVDRRSDLYAVGLCLYELVTGKNPFDDVPPGELMARVATPSIRPLMEVEPLCPPALSDAVARALSPDPAQRFQSAEEFRAKLQSILLEIDPHIGSETASRFMREAFAVEYQAERKMLAMLREQAKQISDEEAAEAQAAQEAERTTRPLSAPRPTPVATPALEFDDPTPLSSRPLPAEGLSFQPTKKTAGRMTKSRDNEPTDALAQALPPPVDAEPSIVVDGLPAKMEDPAPPPPRRPPPRVEVKEKEPSGSKRAPVKSGPKPTGEASPPRQKTGQRPAVKREATPPPPSKPERTTTPLEQPAAAAPAPQKKHGSLVAWLVIPLLALLAVGGYIAWDIYSDQITQKQLEDEQQQQDEQDTAAPETDRKSREVKVDTGEGEPLTELPKDEKPVDEKKADAKKKPPVAKPAAAAGTPGEKALRALKSDYAKLQDENVARPFKMKLHVFENEVGAKGNDPDFVKAVTDLHEQVKTELAKQN